MQGMMCVRCKGKGLCGKRNCEILAKTDALRTMTAKVRKDFSGISPPSVFVGRFGYPDVFMGTLAPVDDRSVDICDNAGSWFRKGMAIDDIIDMRSHLINSRCKVNVRSSNRFKESMQEIAASRKPVDIEASYKRPLNPQISLYERSAPVGPAGEIERFNVCQNISIPRKIDKVISDTDLKAASGINTLYSKKIDESSITKLLSSGILGAKQERKLVPTRWAITAVDDIIGRDLIRHVKNEETIDSFHVYSSQYLGNHFEILMLPSVWRFENIEASYSKSFWNPTEETVMYQDYENYGGRKKYASNVTGAYYSARLAVLEHLSRIKRQASVLVLREIHDDYYAPLGVWLIRETVRDAFRRKPAVFQSIDDAKQYIRARLKTPVETFINRSRLIREFRQQRDLFSFARRKR